MYLLFSRPLLKRGTGAKIQLQAVSRWQIDESTQGTIGGMTAK